HNQWSVQVDRTASPGAVSIDLGSNCPMVNAEPAITARVTNRRVYDASTVPEAIQERLQQTAAVGEGIRVRWLFDRTRLPALAALIGRADALMFGERTMRQAFLSKVRF